MSALYRLYNNSIHDHFYTTIPAQRDNASNTLNYKYEKIECYISDRKFDNPNCGYLFRLYNPTTDVHFYTSNEDERNNKIIAGFSYEGIVGFIYNNSVEGAFPLYYLENQTNTDNFYTISKFEYDNAINNYGFVNRGTIGYVSPVGLKEPIAHNRPQGNFTGIDAATGAFRPPSFVDLSLNGVGPEMAFTRYYNSYNFMELPLGPGWSHSFYSYILEAPNGDTLIKWGNSAESYFTNDGNNNFTPDPGNFDILTRVQDSMNEGYTLTTKEQTVYAFRKLSTNPPPGSPFVPQIVLIYIEDRNGNRMNFSYNAASGMLYEVRDASGRTFSLDYSSSPLRLKKVTDNSLNRSIYFEYDDKDCLKSFKDARGNVIYYNYNADTLLLSTITYPEGNIVTLTYDEKQRVKGYTNGDIALGVSYDSPGTIFTTPNNTISFFHYSDDRVKSIKDAYSNEIGFEYFTGNNLNLPQKVTDRNNSATLYTYDNRGNILTATNALNQTTHFTCDDKNNLLTTTDFRGNTTKYDYDPEKVNLEKITRPMGGITNFSYYPNGQIKTITDPNNHTISYLYNLYGNMTQAKDDALNTYIDFTYDTAGRMLTKEDQLNRKTTYSYDENDSLTKVTDANTKITDYNYDKNNRLTKITDARTKETIYTYNSMNLLKTEKDPMLNLYQYGYDSKGNLNSIKDPDSNETGYIYDDNNRLKEIRYNGTTKVSFTEYDNNDNLKKMSDENGNTSFTYDPLGRITSTNDSFGKTVSWQYFDADNRIEMTYPGNKVVNYYYDKDNQLTKVVDWLGGETIYNYDSAGILQSATNPNGTKVVYSYDDADRLTGLSNKKANDTIIAGYTYTLDDFGNHRQVVKNEPMESTPTATNITYAYDDANRITSAGNITYTHDNRGNLTGASNGNVYIFDYADRLKEVTIGGKSIQYLYDGIGNRIARTQDGIQTRYVLDLNSPMSQVLAETDSNGNVINYYVYGHGLISKITAGGQRYCYHFDSRGSTIAITDSGENITDKYAYDEFGKVLASQETNSNPFRYVGGHGVMDEGNGLLFMRARYYDVDTGRFLSKDPIRGELVEPGSLNRYVYAMGNPMMGVDPEGLNPFNTANSTPMIVENRGTIKKYVSLFTGKAGWKAAGKGWKEAGKETARFSGRLAKETPALVWTVGASFLLTGGQIWADPSVYLQISQSTRNVAGINSPELNDTDNALQGTTVCLDVMSLSEKHLLSIGNSYFSGFSKVLNIGGGIREVYGWSSLFNR